MAKTRQANMPLRLGLLSLAGSMCCLTWIAGPFVALIGFVWGFGDVREARKRDQGMARAVLGLACSVAACAFWICFLVLVGQGDVSYN